MWKKELQANYSQERNINWKNTQSWTWQDGPENIIRVYVSPSVRQTYDLRDIAVLCSVWMNCKTFKLNPQICGRIKGLRNKHCAHNPAMTVEDNDKAKVFDALKDLFKENDILSHIDRRKCNKELADIEKEDPENKELLRITEEMRKLKETELSNAKRIERIQQMIADQPNQTMKIIEKQFASYSKMPIISIFLTLCLALVGGGSLLYTFLLNDMLTPRPALTPGRDLSDTQGMVQKQGNEIFYRVNSRFVGR